MNEKQLKGLLDLVVKTVNDLSKHHAGETLELVSGEMDERVVEFTKSLEQIATAVNKLDDDQTTAYEELTEAIKHIEQLDDGINEKIDSLGKQSTERQDTLRDMCVDLGTKLSDLEKSTALCASRSVTQDLQESIKILIELTDTENENTGTKFFNLSASIVKITEELGKVHDNVELLKGAPEELLKVTQAVGEVSESLDTVQRAHEEAIDSIVTDIVKANDHIGKLKESLIGHGDDLRTLSDQMHKRMDDCEAKDEEVIEAIDNTSADIAKLAQANDVFIQTVDKQYELLSEKFNDLKQESFLSSEKIDRKFAEMNLELVKLDVERENRIKVVVSEQGDEILAQLNEQFKEYRRNIGNQVEASNKLVADNVDDMLSEKAQNIMNSKSWVPGDWEAGAVCRNRGGLWQAVRDTDAEPSAESGDWICGASGFHSAQVIATHATGLNVTVGVEDTLGNVHEIKIPLPKINYIKGSHDPDVDYLYNDSIMKDGCRWVATKDHPEHDPGDDGEDWAVLTMRGPKGHKGATGDTGKQGLTGEKGNKGDKGAKGDKGDDGVSPKMEAIVKALVEYDNNGDGQLIRRARGQWNIKNNYSAGDVVTVGQGLFLAVRDNDGNTPPGSATEDWLLLIQASGGGGSVATADPTKHPLLWKDLMSTFTEGKAATLPPSFEVWLGGIFAWNFDTGHQLFLTFHLDHDYAVGTDFFPHVHWCPETDMADGETVSWEIEWTAARGHRGEVFSTPDTIATAELTYTSVGVTPANTHIITEVATGVQPTDAEVDMIIAARVSRGAGTYVDGVFGFSLDAHYLADHFGTINKAPDFYN